MRITCSNGMILHVLCQSKFFFGRGAYEICISSQPGLTKTIVTDYKKKRWKIIFYLEANSIHRCYLSQWTFEYPFFTSDSMFARSPCCIEQRGHIIHSILVSSSNSTQWYQWTLFRKLRILFSKINKVGANFHFI